MLELPSLRRETRYGMPAADQIMFQHHRREPSAFRHSATGNHFAAAGAPPLHPGSRARAKSHGWRQVWNRASCARFHRAGNRAG